MKYTCTLNDKNIQTVSTYHTQKILGRENWLFIWTNKRHIGIVDDSNRWLYYIFFLRRHPCYSREALYYTYKIKWWMH